MLVCYKNQYNDNLLWIGVSISHQNEWLQCLFEWFSGVKITQYCHSSWVKTLIWSMYVTKFTALFALNLNVFTFHSVMWPITVYIPISFLLLFPQLSGMHSLTMRYIYYLSTLLLTILMYIEYTLHLYNI